MRGVTRPYEQCHKVIDDTMYKLCSDCNEWMIMEDNFYKNKTAPDGCNPYCKDCTKKRSSKWIKEHPERYEEIRKVTNEKPKSKILRRKASERARIKGKRTEWQRNNKDKIQGYNLSRNLNKKHEISKQEWIDCKNYFNNECAYCGITENEAKETQGQYLHKEHVNHNGENDLSNCVPSCRSCNSKKNTFTLEEWYRKENELYEHYSSERLQKIYKWLNEDYMKYIVK